VVGQQGGDGLACSEPLLARVGALARRVGPPVVAASSIGSWEWCPLKAWHATTLFNAGWLEPGRLEDWAWDGLAVLWAAELAKKAMPRIIRGLIIHGEEVRPLEAGYSLEAARLLARHQGRALRDLHARGVLPVLGLIEPRAYEVQLQRYRGASDLVEYFRREEWPLVARRSPRGYMVIGVPDSIEETSGGYRIVEVKTTRRPDLMARGRGRGYRSALAQLAAYAWILLERWPIEEAVLVVRDPEGRQVAAKKLDPLSLADMFEEKLLPIASRLAAETPPRRREWAPCKSCEYGHQYPAQG
jgi:CRISPR/Cas system-associated exonuclease Cas4 (RecB family)